MSAMSKPAISVHSKNALREVVCDIGAALGLEVHRELDGGQRIWGAKRSIDVVLIHKQTRKTLGIECIYGDGDRVVEEGVAALVQDMSIWPMKGLLVFSEDGLRSTATGYLISTGKAVELDDLEPWLRLYFGLPLA